MIRVENIPLYLKVNAKWCNQRYENRDFGMMKVPYNPRTNNHASMKISSTFTNFDSVINALNSYNGIGIRVDGKLIAIALDHCVENGSSVFLGDIVSYFGNTYIQISLSGVGLCIIVFASDGYVYDKYANHIKKDDMEVYIADATNHFVTITENVYLKNVI